ncbi:MAG: homocysteine S-methyltransferase family protein [Syntrophaceae bacterium]|nr:homocysteine S-methyltransferase family protein [Syntrophaceae bacterium]
MKTKGRISALLKKKILILDGAMGTELYKRGLPAGGCPEVWCLHHPEAVAAIHGAYHAAGAAGIYTATFGANRVKLGRYGVTDVVATNQALARIARETVGPRGIVFGDIGPTGRFVEPFGDLPFTEAVAVFREQAEGLLAGGVDGFVIETMMDIQEARAALIAVQEVADLFTIVSMTYEASGRTLNGTDPLTALVTLQALGADAVGCNCSAGPEAMLAMISQMKPYAIIPLLAKPNAGLPELVGEETVFTMDAERFACLGPAFAEAGVNLMGGCCGTTPDHIAALAGRLAALPPADPVRRTLTAASSARQALILERGQPLALVGGWLNLAENETLRQVAAAGEVGPLRQAAREQDRAGAQLLQWKAVASGLTEEEAPDAVLAQLTPTTRLPFLIDSEEGGGVERLLERYPGRVLLRSKAGEKVSQLLMAASRYGAVPILAVPPEGGPPYCKAEIRSVLTEAMRYGFPKGGVVIELTPATVLPAASVLQTLLGLISWCSEKVGCPTLLGLTAIGRDLPERPWLQAAFLASAQAAGLTLVIADPGIAELGGIRAAGNLLHRRATA